MNEDAASIIGWTEDGSERTSRWQSENGAPPPRVVRIVNDSTTADVAYKMATIGEALLWRGDYNNARQLLTAMARRVPAAKHLPAASGAERFHLHRQYQARRARVLGMLLVELDSDVRLDLGRAPDVRAAVTDALGPDAAPCVLSLRELLGMVGAHEWRRKGVFVPALDASIHPHYGVFSPVRGEYVRLVADAPLPDTDRAFDIGTGSGVLAAVLARRGVTSVVATDKDPRSVACARANIDALGYADRVEVVQADIFPSGRAGLIVCNPPWIPTKPTSGIEHAVYDPGSRMLKSFLSRLRGHLTPDGEAWLVVSDLAELLELVTRADLLTAIDAAGLAVVGRTDTTPTHSRVTDSSDVLHEARSRETTSLWRLRAR
ncbi:methyltransferase [Rhodococcus sp. 06-470-2]|uniref:methyltransferase n=1 Tax=Nocardiaceae TaxID=85025 RepID=UPI00068DC0E4|nr:MULTISPECIES: class I SAM-dependent methyltransferase [Rhodococcus]OZC70228.1 methyltransferase [Rhodococcus sp. 06-470-2]OZD74754.1 methyltransferase [Rhodococcus sp. 05-339-2]OZE13433.1 methyltransferase [Rhodococcus sp. 05-2255-3C]OZE15952.1 methyltransferase [Rhodococcus sp. 05-2255-3B1]OZE18991.1 methyltransferase [Rhodococcus sp. 05-2255-2A2]